jgi:hypothetical protein
MTVHKLYDDFRVSFPEMAQATDVLHAEIWDLEDDLAMSVWFEDLARALNTRMSLSGLQVEIDGIFTFFDDRWGTGSVEVRSCIDVSLVENLFWEVPPKQAAYIWRNIPVRLQNLYIGFHGTPPDKS